MSVSSSSSLGIVGAILAGGAGTRLGGVSKATLKLGGGTLLGHVRQRLSAQVPATILCVAAEHMEMPWARASALPIVTDPIPDAGPLAGVAAALYWAREYSTAAHVLTVPVDCPFLPDDLAQRLGAAATNKTIATAASGGQRHHAVALWPVILIDTLLKDLVAGARRIRDWQDAQGVVDVEWPIMPFDPFFNINTPDDLAAARAMTEHQIMNA